MRLFHISKANARIEELETQLAAVTKERDEAKAALESNASEVSASAEQLQKDLTTAKASIESLTGQLNTANASVTAKDTEIAALNTKLSGQSEVVKVQVAQQVAQTQSALGQPPMPAAPASASKNSDKKGMEKVHAAALADLAAGGYRPN